MPLSTTWPRVLCAFAVLWATAARAQAGPIFVTGHDPDFHAQDSPGARNLLSVGLNFVTGGAATDPTRKFLWVESFAAPLGGHRVGEDGLNALGLVAGVHYDWMNAAGVAGVNFADYEAIAVASSFGGMLTRAELDQLITRSADIKTFVNAGGGLMALAECHPSSGHCDDRTLRSPDGTPPSLFGFLPVTVTSVGTLQGYTVTPFGMSLGLTDADVNDPTHNSFGVIAGLEVVDRDNGGTPTTLAGHVQIDDGGFTPVPVPEPGSLLLLGSGVAALAARSRRRRKP